jgi:NADP-dependent 3-hydroxy acid dehydrogenase YdfG
MAGPAELDLSGRPAVVTGAASGIGGNSTCSAGHHQLVRPP